jgi:peptide/nickel transport system ATP-binding protein
VIIAMALACNPELVVLDEPSSALDVTIQAQILRLLISLRARHNMSMLFVTHDLGVLAQISSRLAVMYAGELVEVATTADLYDRPRHPYTRGLISAVPQMSEQKEAAERLKGLLRRDELPEIGCRFAPRCPYAQPPCLTEPQSLDRVGPDHQVACWRWQAIAESPAPRGEVAPNER